MSVKEQVRNNEVLASNCQAVAARFNMNKIPNLSMCDNFDGSVEYQWRTPNECTRILVYEDHYRHLTQDIHTGKLLNNEQHNFIKSDGTLDFVPATE